MKKRKPILSHVILDTYVSSFSVIDIEKHTDVRTGISMFSLNSDNVPVITCDNYMFLHDLLDTFDTDEIGFILDKVCIYRTLTHSESEE